MTNSVNSAKDLDSILFDISPKIKELAGLCEANTGIDKELFVKYDVKRGLRDSAGKGVLTGLTEISDVNGYKLVNGRRIPADGQLFYQGINVQDIINGLNQFFLRGTALDKGTIQFLLFLCKASHLRPLPDGFGGFSSGNFFRGFIPFRVFL